jgi:hypothetical protein
MEQLAGQVAVVTGAGGGIGVEVVAPECDVTDRDAGRAHLRELIRPMSVAIAGQLLPR